MNIENIDEKMLMEEYGISKTTKTVYQYKIYRYENIMDAVNYAKICKDKNIYESEVHDP